MDFYSCTIRLLYSFVTTYNCKAKFTKSKLIFKIFYTGMLVRKQTKKMFLKSDILMKIDKK